MCGRFTLRSPAADWCQLFLPDLSPPELPFEEPARYNIAPTQPIVCIMREATGQPRKAVRMRWGLIPAWAKAFESRYSTFNARIETVADKASFKQAWGRQQRCVIPMAGYYEWRTLTSGKGKQPYYISDVNSGCVLAAGIYEYWGDDRLLSCTMLTRPATELLAGIHGRMPVLLNETSLRAWMSDSNASVLNSYLDFEQPDLLLWPVSKAVGNVRNDSPELIQKVEQEH